VLNELIVVVLYARVSSREQEQEGYSIPAQLKLLREYASRHGFHIVREFVDVETAKTTGRKSFGEMIEFLKHSRHRRVVLVEKTDRLYRNFRDAVTLEDLDAEIHFVKENQILSKNSRSQDKLAHGLHLLIARNYVENLREEVIKGMKEKAEQGIYPGHAPFGYVNDRAERNIKIHPEESPVVRRMFEVYAGAHTSLSEVRKLLRGEFGKTFSKGYLHRMLQNPFYLGFFVWRGTTYRGNHEALIDNELFQRVQQAFRQHNKGKYRKHEIAFRGLLTCARDQCTMTAEKKKGKYVYYRCSGYRGKCDTPRFREEEISQRMGELLKNIRVPDEVVERIELALTHDQQRLEKDAETQRVRLEQRLANVRQRVDRAYDDKLSGAIDEDFWQRKMNDWRSQEQQAQMALHGLKDANAGDRLLSAKRILELANKAYFLYLTRKPAEQAELLRLVLLNCAIDGASLYPTYRKPFDLIFQRAKNQDWSGREDLNLRPPGPKQKQSKNLNASSGVA
jgi:DNA invertase Pin-like site-specific DNA recombinase